MSKASKLIVITIIIVAIVGVILRMAAKNRPTQPTNEIATPADKNDLYTIQLPMGWTITDKEGAKGVQLSFLRAQSLDFKYVDDTRVDGPFTPTYYKSGAMLDIHVTTGEDKPPYHQYAQGGQVFRTGNININGIAGVYHAFAEPSTAEGQLIDSHINYKGNSYLLTLHYNPTTYPQGEKVFLEILNSFKFVR